MKRVRIAVVAIAVIVLTFVLSGCIGGDKTAQDPQEHEGCYFTLELREPGLDNEREDWDAYPHSTLDGAIIMSWEIPMYGNTVYESVVKFFEDRADSVTFRKTQHKFQMFHEYINEDGDVWNLETVYVAADGEYAMTANYQEILGDDGIAGTDDDLKVLTLVYKGWLY
ncbi:MAG: hypothetical protein K2O95_00745 [Clostridia bacterium]|nr:hypothetical protein [Clostridia bacterium]MDE7078627.1 hypothetical protein [Clostridia bacterium]